MFKNWINGGWTRWSNLYTGSNKFDNVKWSLDSFQIQQWSCNSDQSSLWIYTKMKMSYSGVLSKFLQHIGSIEEFAKKPANIGTGNNTNNSNNNQWSASSLSEMPANQLKSLFVLFAKALVSAWPMSGIYNYIAMSYEYRPCNTKSISQITGIGNTDIG